MLHNKPIILTLFLSFLLFPHISSAQTQTDMQALGNLSELKVYFDVKADSVAKLEKRLVWINDTYEQARQKGLKPLFVVGFRSQASLFVSKDDDYLDEEEIPLKRKIVTWLKHFAKIGIHAEQCGLSAEIFDIDHEDFLPEITVVQNSYLSIAAYQNRGYAYVPM